VLDPDYSPDAGTGLLSLISYKCCSVEIYVWGKSHIHILVFSARRGFKMVLFTEPSDNLCRRYMHSTESPSSSFCGICTLPANWKSHVSQLVAGSYAGQTILMSRKCCMIQTWLPQPSIILSEGCGGYRPLISK